MAVLCCVAQKAASVAHRGRKCSFRGIPGFVEELIPKLGMEWNYRKKMCFAKNPAPANRIESLFSSANCFRAKF
jgi:hypothetical protein